MNIFITTHSFVKHYRFLKVPLPDDESECARVAMSLMNFRVSLAQYSDSLVQPEIRM